MPNVVIEGPRIEDINVKRELIENITNALEKAFNLPRDAYIILLKENSPENVGIGGKLLIDRQ